MCKQLETPTVATVEAHRGNEPAGPPRLPAVRL